MGYTVIPQDTFNELQVDAGVILKTFNPASPSTPADADIVCATTGGINIVCQGTFEDWGEDVDNCPNNTKELKRLTGWDCRFSTTCLAASAEAIKLGLGAADFTEATYAASEDTSVDPDKTYYLRTGTSGSYVYTKVTSPTGNPTTNSYYEMQAPGQMVTPRATLSQGDFTNELWWVGDRADGGLVAVKLMNVLSTSGFSLQTTKKGKGQFTLDLTGHVSINAQDTVPMVFYSMDAT